MKKLLAIFLFTLLFPAFFSATVFAAPIRRVLPTDFYEQGLQVLTLDAEGASDFRYCGIENKLHTYRGIIKPGDKLKFTINATIAPMKYIPLKKRSSELRIEVIAKKGQQVLKKDSYKKTNKSNLFLDYTVPDGTDTLEVSESFALLNDSNTPRYNVTRIDRSRFILMTKDMAAAAGVTNSGKFSASAGGGDGGGYGKIALGLAVIGGGAFFFLKKRKAASSTADQTIPNSYQPVPNVPSQPDNTVPQPARAKAWPPAPKVTIPTFPQKDSPSKIQPQPEIPKPAENKPRFCTECGAQLKPGAAFCTECGTKCN